jgi:anthranilate/para-aminobenzoate synthase component I
MRDWNLYNKASENIDRSGKKTLDKLTEAVDAADAAQEKSKVGLLWNSAEPSEKAALAYRKAVEARDKFQREQIKKQLNLATTAPDFPGKQAVVDNLAKELELFPEPTAPKESKPETSSKPAAKAEPTATSAKPGATSNKPTAKLTPEQNNAAITKANEAIKNGADPEKVKARLKEAGVSFKE